jgi:maltooligosyltrehalose trehalohydrolase
MIRRLRDPVFGAIPAENGVRFSLWAPRATRVELLLASGEMDLEPDQTQPGRWHLTVPDAKAGDRYAFAIDGGDPRPDPAARFLPDGVHEWAEIVDPRLFRWTDDAWGGLDPRRAVIYELHIGTFTPEGTFRAAMEKLPYLRSLGVTAIEIMPVADFAGSRNWGYDGVALFAPSRAYGAPDDLRALVNAAHEAGLAVILDVVYNHLGPEGAYLPEISPLFLTRTHATPWGAAVNLDDEGSDSVRAFLIDNALHWLDEYHADGLRLDATHALHDSRERHFVAELADVVHRFTDPAPLLYAEDSRNLAALLEPPGRGGWGLDGVWADDFHHVIRTMLAGDRHGYYADYDGTARELAATVAGGWLFTGQQSAHKGAPRGTDPTSTPLRKAVVCVQNHDQIGNRALGDRLHHAIEPAAWRAAVTVLLTAPMTPLLFMGQEWATSSPFQFFTDFSPELGRQVVEGRRREFTAFPEFAAAEGACRIPDPQAASTFASSRLRWDEIDEGDHARSLALHRALLALRATPAFEGSDACTGEAAAVDEDTVAFWRGLARDGLVVARLRGSGVVRVPGLGATFTRLIDTEDTSFASDPQPAVIDGLAGTVAFARPGAVVLGRA